MQIRNNLNVLYFLLILVSFGCAKKPIYEANTDRSTITVDSQIVADENIVNIIEPYKVQLDQTMNEVIGYSSVEMVKQKGESTLGNFVADAILKKSIEAYGREIDMAAITIGGLRNPIPEGAVMLKSVYELMPFENAVYILELTGGETRQLFDYLAEKQNIAISNSMVILRGEDILNVFIGGKPLDENQTYTLAISDYLAGGGDHMAFLKEAKVIEKLTLKVRDLLIEEIREQNSSGQKISASIEGRIKYL